MAREQLATLLAVLGAVAGQDTGYELLWKSQLDEFSSHCVKVSGHIPAWALGAFIIPSVGQFELGDRKFAGQLDAFGKMHRFELRESEVCATYRMMATKFFNTSKQANTIAAGLLFFETEPPRHCPWWDPICNMVAGNDNTFVNTIKHGGKLLSLTDGPTLLEIDPQSMNVTGTFRFADTLEGKVCYTSSAHPVQHPRTGDWIDFVGNANLFSGATVRLWHLSENDPYNRRSLADIPVDSPPYMHSFGLTEKYAVLPHMPVSFDVKAVALKPMHEAFKEVELTEATSAANAFRLVPLDGGAPKLRKLPLDQKLFYTHTVNAYENDTGIVIDLCTLKQNPFASNLTIAAGTDKATRDQSEHNLVKRFVLPYADDVPVTAEVISDPAVGTDFTRINPMYQGYRHCFYWGVQWFTDGKAYGSMAIAKYDVCNGAARRQWYRPNWFPSEATFVPSSDGYASEDDGVLLFTALDGVKGDTHLMVVNASTMETMAERLRRVACQMAAEGPFAAGHASESDARALLENPPDGVDLEALGAGAGQLLPPEECERLYQDAFEAAGGAAALEAAKELSAALGAEVAAGTSGPAQQLKVWQAYDLSSMMQRLGDGSAVRRHGERRLAGLSQALRRAVHPEVELNIAGVKKWGRASVKVRIKYASDCSQLCDLNRAELVCPSVEVMYAAARHLFELWGPRAARHDTRLVEWEDRYQVPMPGGYRHLQVLACLGGCIWELQLNTAPMLEAKHRAGHKLYKTTRFVKEMILLTSMEGDSAVLRDLLAKPGVQGVANPNEARDKNGLTALHHVAFRGDEELLEALLAGEGLAAAADPWATDRSNYGGLPLSYALQMRSHRAAQALARRMAPPPPDLSSAARSRLAEAAAAVIDAHEEALESRHWELRGSELRGLSSLTRASSEDFEEVSQVTEELLRMLAGLWQAVSPDDTWKGMDPLAYAFHTEATSSLRILMECTDLWAVDDQGRLPIERAAHLGFWDLLDRAASLMSATQPLQVSADAAWSLARCRAANLPQELLGELPQDRRLQRRIYTCGPAKQLDVSVSHSGEGTVLRQSDALELKGLKEVTPEAAYRCMVLEDDTLYVGTADGSIDKWDVKTMELVGKWQAHSQRVSCLLLGSKRPYFDGTQRARKLFSGSFDNTVRIWDLWKAKGHCIGVLKHTEDVRALSRYGCVLFAAQGPRIALWDIAKVGNMRKSGELRGHPGLVDVLTLTGGMLLSSGQGGDIRVWAKAESGVDQWSELACWKGHSENFRVRCIASDGNGRVFSAAHGDAGSQYKGPGAWSQTQKDAKAELCFWTREGVLTAKQHSSSPITGMQCLEGVLFTADLGGHVRLWNAASCEPFAAFPAHGGPIRAFLICNGGNPADPLEAVEESEEESTEQVRSRPTSRAQSSEPGARALSAASDRSKADHARPGENGAGARPESVTSSGTRGSAGGRSEASSLPRLQPPRLPFFRSGTERSVQRATRSGSRSRASSSRVSSSMSPHSRSPASSSVSTTDGNSWPLTPMQRGKAAAEVSHRMLLPPRQPLDGSYQAM